MNKFNTVAWVKDAKADQTAQVSRQVFVTVGYEIDGNMPTGMFVCNEGGRDITRDLIDGEYDLLITKAREYATAARPS